MYPLGFNTKLVSDYQHAADQSAQELDTQTWCRLHSPL